MSRTRRRSPEVRSTAFTARPPDLPPRLLMAVDFAITCSLVQPGRPRYPVLVHQAAALLRASFRPRLAAAPLRFANPSPPSGWIEDFHLQALDHARHTRKAPPKRGQLLSLRRWIIRNESSGKVPCSCDREFSYFILITLGWYDDFNCHPFLTELDQHSRFAGNQWPKKNRVHPVKIHSLFLQ